MTRRHAAAVAALAAYVAVVVWLTWPLASSLETLDTHLAEPHSVARFDALYAAWALAWETHVLTTAPLRFADANIYHPAAHALFYGPTSLGALPWFAPTFLASGNPARATNLMFLASLALTAWTLHLAVVAFTGSQAAAIVAASALLTDRWLLWLAPTAPMYTVLQYWPLMILVAARPQLRLAAFVPLLVLQTLTDPIYIGVSICATLGVLTLTRLVVPSRRPSGLRLVVALAIAVACLAPVYAGYAWIKAHNPDLATQTVHVYTPRWRYGFWAALKETPAAIAGPALLLVPLGALVALLDRSDRLTAPVWRHGLLWTLVGLVLAVPNMMPPSAVPFVPSQLFANLAIRVPARLAIGSMFGCALLAGAGFAACTRRLTRWPAVNAVLRGVAAALVVWAIYSEYTGGPSLPGFWRGPVPQAYPMFDAPVPDPDIIAAIQNAPGALLELPLGGHNTSAIFHAQSMYRSIWHWRPILNGYSSYWPEGFTQRMATAARLPDQDALLALRRDAGVGMILLRWNLMAPWEQARWVALAANTVKSQLKTVAWKSDGLLFVVREDATLP